jgi:uncharacterized protein YbaP (TraB family)
MIKQKVTSFRFRLVVCGMALLFSCVLIAQEAAAQSLLWRISGKGTTAPSYLYGTIHLTDARIFEWKDSVYSRLGLCQAFAAELDLSMENMMKAAGMMLLPEGQTLHDRFTEQDYELVRTAVKSCSGYDLSLLDKLKPPALVALCYAGKKSAADMEATVDELLYRRAKTEGLETYGIETVEEQVALLDKIPDNYVLEYFKNLDKQDQEFESLIRCYRRADLDSLWVLMQDEESGALLNEELIRLRNYRMTERIIPLIRKAGTFIAVGSGHLPGAEGMIALLRKEGFVVEPVRIW